MYICKIPYPLKGLFPKNVIWNFDFKEPILYLTFDDGPNPSTTSYILGLLNKNRIKATFFCTGKNIENHPELFQQIKDSGHSTGNHTFSHISGWQTPLKEYTDDFKHCETLCKTSLFRPPYGRITPSQAKEIGKTHKIIMWTVLTGDFDPGKTPEKCLATAKKYIKNGSIIVFHDSEKARQRMLYALPRFIDYSLENGFRFEKISK
ncbi:MAG: polysaccharide deacetylase family protein [Chloroflexi bacterium]|nr:polysaccharide deacetylase family protein [Chloroflexota bacterium]